MKVENRRVMIRKLCIKEKKRNVTLLKENNLERKSYRYRGNELSK